MLSVKQLLQYTERVQRYCHQSPGVVLTSRLAALGGTFEWTSKITACDIACPSAHNIKTFSTLMNLIEIQWDQDSCHATCQLAVAYCAYSLRLLQLNFSRVSKPKCKDFIKTVLWSLYMTDPRPFQLDSIVL